MARSAMIQKSTLGPPDLLVIKGTETGGETWYAHLTGIETSSIKQIENLIALTGREQSLVGWFLGWNTEYTYCTYDAINKIDVRVSVNSKKKCTALGYRLDGEVIDLENEQWNDVWGTGVIRALLYNEQEFHYTHIQNGGDGWYTSDVLRQLRGKSDVFYEFFVKNFTKGIELGGATPWSNRLVEAFFKHVTLTETLFEAQYALDKLREKIGLHEVIDLIEARLMMENNQEMKSIQLLNQIIMKPELSLEYCCEVLNTQAIFCLKKKRPLWAQVCIEHAIARNPTSAFLWATLSRTYLERERYGEALISLNLMPLSALAIGTDISRLPSIAKQAYELLTYICYKIGWDELLEFRSTVFVLEEHYDGSVSPQDTDSFVSRYKRMCEPWLENMFQMLYEDLRVYTIWRAEYLYQSAYSNQRIGSSTTLVSDSGTLVETTKTPSDLHVLGDLAVRLHFKQDAVEAYEASLQLELSADVAYALFELYSEAYSHQASHMSHTLTKMTLESEDETKFILLIADLLHHFSEKEHIQFMPNLVLEMKNLINRIGGIKIRAVLVANKKRGKVIEVLDELVDWYGVEGSLD